MALVIITPKGGLIVRHASGKQLDPAGEALELTPWWIRRRSDGDVDVIDPPIEVPALEVLSVAPAVAITETVPAETAPAA